METNKEEQLPSCCQKKESKGWMQGLLYGLIPHAGCIAFIIGSVLGVTVLMQFFKPLLMNRYFFDILIVISLLFATLSSVLYLRKQGMLSANGIKHKWKYLAGMYGSTIGINLILFMLIFPMLANVGSASGTQTADQIQALSTITLKVDIPCPGHAPLISNELKTLGVSDVKFSFPNNFDVKYDPNRLTKESILGLDVFKEYKATVITEQNNVLNADSASQPVAASTNTASTIPAGACGASGGSSGCGSCGGCGGSSGSCGGCGSR
jgi:uncharacterized membrane protein YgcG